MKLHDLKPAEGSRQTSKRIGRGYGSGKGKTGGKGMMGQKARAGRGAYRTFEGGQNRIVKRMPFKRGFVNIWRTEYQIVNVETLQDWSPDTTVSPETLLEARVIRKKNVPVKILGNGDLSQKLTVRAHKFTGSARAKIEAAGGTIEELPLNTERRSRSKGPNPAMRKRRTADTPSGA